MKTLVPRYFLLIKALLFMVFFCPWSCWAEETPAERYRSYLGAIKKASSVQDIYSFISAAASEKFREIAGQREEEIFLAMEKTEANGFGDKLVKQEIKGNSAVLVYDNKLSYPYSGPGKLEEASVTVYFVKEDGTWKIDQKDIKIRTKSPMPR